MERPKAIVPVDQGLGLQPESRPKYLDIHQYLERLLAGEPAEHVFQLTPTPIVDHHAVVNSHMLRDPKHDYIWQVKAVVETAKAAACGTIRSSLDTFTPSTPLPEPDAKADTDARNLIKDRARETFDQIKPQCLSMIHKPREHSLYEKTLHILEGYFNTSLPIVRAGLLRRIAKEELHRRLSADFIDLVYDVLTNDPNGIPKPTSGELVAVALSSDTVYLLPATRGKAHLLAMAHTDSLTIDGVISGFDRSAYELVPRAGQAPMIRYKRSYRRLATKTKLRHYTGGAYDTTATPCPAMNRLAEADSDRAFERSTSLIQLIVHKACES